MNTPVLHRICIDRTAPKPVSPVIYGWHYEEIGMIGDGGLYAEMIRNRNFSESGTAPGMQIKDGLYQNIPHADRPNCLPEYLPELDGWSALGESVSIGRITLNESGRVYAMTVKRSASEKEGICGAANSGFSVCIRRRGRNTGCRFIFVRSPPGEA